MFAYKAQNIAPGVYMVGGPELSDSRDCLCYLVSGSKARVLIDCGCGPSSPRILKLASDAAGAPPTHLLLTHCHIDHAGGAAQIKRDCGCEVLVHTAEADVLINGDAVRSAAGWYNMQLPPLQPDRLLNSEGTIDLGGDVLNIIHTPGHTPGSVCAWADIGGKRVLFGQDLHGPFFRDFLSDLGQYEQSMNKLLALEADVLCEGHYGVFEPAESAAAFMRQQMALNLG